MALAMPMLQASWLRCSLPLTTHFPNSPTTQFPKYHISTYASIRPQLPDWKEEDEEEREQVTALKNTQALIALNTFESDSNSVLASPDTILVPESPEVEVVFENRDEDGDPFWIRVQKKEELFKVLDSCKDASDMALVGEAYEFLTMQGLIPSFGRYKSRASEGPRVVTPAIMMSMVGMEASKFSPKKWGANGSSALILAASLATIAYLGNNGVDTRPLLFVAVGFSLLDSIYLGGTGVGQLLSLWKPFKRRLLVHEAGHVLVAYLLGCPVRGVILDTMEALNAGIRGLAGTQFWDATLEDELRQNRLTATTIDRYTMVLFAGVAAEAMVYGEAEGGESDENLYKSIVSQLQPSWSPAKMSNHARWAVIQSYNLLKEHQEVHKEVVRVLEGGGSMGSIAKAIENAIMR